MIPTKYQISLTVGKAHNHWLQLVWFVCNKNASLQLCQHFLSWLFSASFSLSVHMHTYAFTFCLQKGRRILHRCTITSIHVSYRLTASNKPQQSLTLRKTNGIIPVMIPDSPHVPKKCLLHKRKVINTMYKVCKLRETTIWIWPLCPINQKWA